MSAPNRTYFSNGQALSTPPLTARLSSTVDNVYNFFGLYFVSLFSLDPYAAAESSQFNTRNPTNASHNRPRWSSGTNTRGSGPSGPGGGSGGGSGGSGGGSGNFGSGGRRIGTVDDVRGPECGSCG